ncbi:condensin-2 complex subunit D3 [Strongylocentrotus purpuratus]|uniref:Condensin complex subunit 1 C-terminal domain-containing protein n=1 Tax=Strongylocentrotus purpuratus TaxID=7668 RepID=A0A7M7PD96_STRPU|nr:condensin-2 complex subunit D3 [Strongylocentrotus purpuratus]
MGKMAKETETAERFKTLGIEDLDEEWVNVVWTSDFTENPEPPQSVQGLWSNHRDVLSSLEDAIACSTTWARVDFATLPQGFWNVLCENGIVPRALLAGLHHFMNRVDSLLSSAVEREVAIAAAHLYILLLEIPGSGAYRVQQPMLFEEALDTFKLWPKTETNKRKRPEPRGHQSSQQQAGKKSRRLVSSQTASQKTGDGGDDEEEEEMEDVVSLTTQEVDRIHRAIYHTIKEVVFLLRNVPLKSSEEIIQHVMQRLTEVSRVPTEQGWDCQFGNKSSFENVHSISHLAYLGLEALCSGSHGETSHMLRQVFKHLLPNILMLIGENQSVASTSIPKHIQQMKDHAEAFASHMYKEVGEKALPFMRVLLQHMCVKVPDKVEYRSRVSHTIARILTGMPAETEASFVKWLFLYSKNAKIGYRVFALEVVGALLERPERHSTGEANQQQFLSHRFLLDIMVSRCSDKAPTVRAKALSCLAQFTALAGNQTSNPLSDILAAPTAKTGATPVLVLEHVIKEATAQSTKDNPPAEQAGIEAMDCGPTAKEEGLSQSKEVSIEEEQAENKRPSELKKGATPGNLLGGSPALLFGDESAVGFVGSSGLLNCLKERICDDKVGVRKAALQALENIFKLQCMNFDLQLLEILRERCRDTALSVRKQALDSLTSLLKESTTDERVQRVWLQGILPAVSDRESSVSEKCLQLLQDLVLDGVCRKGVTETKKQLAWSLLCRLMEPDLCDLRVYFQRVCQLWSRQKLLTPALVRGLAEHTQGDNAVAAWMFLAQVSHFCPHLDKTLVLATWHDLTSDLTNRSVNCTGQGSSNSEILTSVLSVIGGLASHLTEKERKDLVQEIVKRLVAVMDTPNIMGAMVETLYKLCRACVGENETTNPLLDQACNKILQACDSYLSQILLTEDAPKPDDATEEMLIARIFLLGEIAQLCPYRMPRRVFTLVQSLLAGPGAISEGSEHPSSQGLTQFSQQPLSQFRTTGSPVSMAVRAHGFVTLGKLCLHHEGLAKQCIAALARELEIAEDAAVRNNVALVMCDLCIRYPNLVDRYVPNLAACLRDKDKLVRKQTLTQLTQLVLEDYVKWRGPLFYRFVSVIVDEVDTVRDFAEYCLVELLLKRHPGMLVQQFVESIFHFNNYQKHAVFNQFTQSERERELFSLEGRENSDKRMTIFKFMLKHMTDEHRFKLTAKLVQEVLGAFVDGAIPLDSESSSVLQDTLQILCCKEMKLASLHSKQANPDDLVEEMQMAEAVMAQAKTKLISQVVKKNVIENIIPVIIALKHMLEAKHSPLLGDLMLYLKELMKEYRNEIKDILSADRQLASEIEFDLRKFDEQQAEASKQAVQEKDQDNTPGKGAAAAAPMADGVQKPPTPGLPKTPQLLSPKAVAGRSPRVMRQSPKTPNAKVAPTKERLLAAQAIVNSARRAFATARRANTPSSNTPGTNASPRVQGNTPPPPQPQPEEEIEGAVEKGGAITGIEERVRRVRVSEDITPEAGLRSPLRESYEQNTSKESVSDLQRAISTPDKTIANITFQAAMDMSIIPLSSPIPTSLPIRVYSEHQPAKGTKSWAPQLDSHEEVKVKQENLVLMFSPEQPAPKPRLWNITSPRAGQKQGSRRPPPADSQPSSTSSDKTEPAGRRSRRRGPSENVPEPERRRSGRTTKAR